MREPPNRGRSSKKYTFKRLLDTRLSRRVLLASSLGAAGTLAIGKIAQGQSPHQRIDTTKTPGFPAGNVGSRTPFEQPQRIQVGQHTWFAPIDRFYGNITPPDLHFTVNHAGIPEVAPNTYELMIHGLVNKPKIFTLADLKRYPSVSRTYFLECSGNSANGAFPPMPTDSAQNVHGLTGTSEWTGVPLSTLLREVGVDKKAEWLLAESYDAAVFARSIPTYKAWNDILVAYGQNGEALRPEQGYPIRLIVPGWEGSVNIKWLRRIEVSTEAFMTREETSKYTDVMPDGTVSQFTFPMEAKSIITWPSGGHQIPSAGFWEVNGIAWSGVGKIMKVEISQNGGRTWEEAKLQQPVIPISHTRYRFPWRWDGKPAILMSRATDDNGNVQPSYDALMESRGIHALYHYNGIQAWKVESDGSVVSIRVSKSKTQSLPHVPSASSGSAGCPGCIVRSGRFPT